MAYSNPAGAGSGRI